MGVINKTGILKISHNITYGCRGYSVDYYDVCKILTGFEGREYDYIEELAADILGVLLREYPDGHWVVTVSKPFPPVSLKLESASFTVEGGEIG